MRDIDSLKLSAVAFAYRSVRRVGQHSPLRGMLSYRYEYMFSPGQLCFLCECLDRTSSLPGPVVEIGCAGGRTTVFLNKYSGRARLGTTLRLHRHVRGVHTG